MKRKILFLIFLIYGMPYCNGEVYQMRSGLIFYRNGEDSTDSITAVLTDIIPSENVFVRMHKDSKNDATFEVVNSKGECFIGSAPKEWPGKKLMDCLKPKGGKIESPIIEGDAIVMGNAEEKHAHAPHSHYLFAFVSQFNDTSWTSFPYDSKDSIKVQHAIDNVCRNMSLLPGKQYFLTQQSATKENICNCLDSISRNTGQGDMVILFLSSHGEKDQTGQFHFITKDSRRNDSTNFSNSLTKMAINQYINELTSKKARVLFFLDACYAGSILDDKEIHGEAAYYLSTNGKSPAFYDKEKGSPFTAALIDVMSGSIKESDCFKNNQVQVGSLGLYLSKIVYGGDQKQNPIYNYHSFHPASILWQLPSDSVNFTYKYPFSARSFVPGWQQIYKGSKVKGYVIMSTEALGVAGIITSFSLKTSYENLMKIDPLNKKSYYLNADMWQKIGYGCIAYTAAIYIYNLIDAIVAPGAKRISVLSPNVAINVAPSITLDGTIGVAAIYNF